MSCIDVKAATIAITDQRGYVRADMPAIQKYMHRTNRCHANMHAMPKHPTPPPEIAPAKSPGPHFDDWNLLRSFLAIYETGTLTEAARRLGTTQPSMGRHLRELETLLGETLFIRLPGQLRANERAQSLFEATAPMHQAIRDAARIFSDNQERIVGVVRVAVSEAYGYYVMPRLLAPLLHGEPELEIEMAVSNRTDNLLRRDADIAVRHFRPQQEELIARKVGETELGLFAHEDYIARFGEPTDYTQPEGAILAGFDREPMPLAQVMRGTVPESPLRFRWRSDSMLTLHAAVECGAAIGMYMVDIAAERPGLRRVLADRIGLRQEVWLCAHDELRRSRRMRYVWDRLVNALEERLGRGR
jgi:DNA-binding transcriptional LysR family regulator